MPAHDPTKAAVIRFPSEKRLAPTIASLEEAQPSEGLLRVRAERRGCRPPRAASALRAFGRVRAGHYLSRLTLPRDLGERRDFLCDWLKPNIRRSLARIAEARALAPGPEAIAAETWAWETAQIILGASEAVEDLLGGTGRLPDASIARHG